MNKEIELTKAISLMYKTYDTKLDNEVLSFLVDSLMEYNLGESLIAIKKAMHGNDFIPRLSHILRHLEANTEDLRAIAMDQLAKVEKAVETGNTSHLGDDVITIKIVNQTGFKRMGDMDKYQWGFFQKNFVQRYMDLYNSKEAQHSLNTGEPMRLGAAMNSLAGMLTSKKITGGNNE